jgi:hypothetical protein
MSPVKYELGFYISEDDILHIHRGENLKSYMKFMVFWDVTPCRLEVAAPSSLPTLKTEVTVFYNC